MQETKCARNNILNMTDFIIYDKVRGDREGGGIAIAARNHLNPVLIAEGDSDVEAISIDNHPSKLVISCTSAYGLQQKHSASKKPKFWEYLDNIANSAWSEGKGFHLQGDLNAWKGSEVIPCDPNIQNFNGKLFHNFLKRHPELTVVNSLPVCRGLITRQRNLNNGKKEQSIIDFVVVCSRVLPFITEMVIDEANTHITTNYTQSKHNVKAVNSDHNTQFVKMNIHVIPHREKKREIYNFKNIKCQKEFKRGTEKAPEFSSCLNSRKSYFS